MKVRNIPLAVISTTYDGDRAVLVHPSGNANFLNVGLSIDTNSAGTSEAEEASESPEASGDVV
jgi:hypothetical protein